MAVVNVLAALNSLHKSIDAAVGLLQQRSV
jgi:hypothetical protein